MTKTTYLDDPEGQNIELYADTPEDGTFEVVDGTLNARHADGTPSDGREPLDVGALLRELTPEDRLDQPMPPDTTMGHVHLYVADLAATMRFYHEVIGFADMGLARAFRMGMVSAGGYHHHIGFNTWIGEGAPPPPPDALGLRYFTIVLPNTTELGYVVERLRQAGMTTMQTEQGILVHDPSQNGVLLTDRNRTDTNVNDKRDLHSQHQPARTAQAADERCNPAPRQSGGISGFDCARHGSLVADCAFSPVLGRGSGLFPVARQDLSGSCGARFAPAGRSGGED
jgi:hypothetical protein